jgi:AraC-like DNA-binding protein
MALRPAFEIAAKMRKDRTKRVMPMSTGETSLNAPCTSANVVPQMITRSTSIKIAFSRFRSINERYLKNEALHNPNRIAVTPGAKQLFDRLNAEIDDRRRRLREHLQAKSAEELLVTFDHDPFFTRLYRHHDLGMLRDRVAKDSVDEATRMLGNLREPIEMLVGSAFNVYQFVGEGISRLPYVNKEVKHEIFSRLLSSKDFIDRHFKQAIPLERLAELACLSRFHFLRLFKQAFKVTPHQYQIQCRLKHACELLRDTDRPAFEIAFEVGFESHTSFATIFKRTFGLTPLAYRFRPDADSQF